MVKRYVLPLALILTLALLLGACAPRAALPTMAPDVAQNYGLAPAQPQLEGRGVVQAPAAPSVASTTVVSGAPNAYAVAAPSEAVRLVIKNATLSIVVTDPAGAVTTISKMAEDMGGFVVTSNTYKTRLPSGVDSPTADITVRVPAAKLDEAMTQIKALVKDPKQDVQSENVSGQDVTKEYTDLQSRLTNLQQAESQLREIMASATKTEDVLNVYNQLTQVREQIEVIQGQIKYYEESAAMSAISAHIVAQAAVEPLSIGGWKPVGVARDAVQTLINGLQVIANLAIWLVLFVVPILAVIALPILLIVWLVRRLILRRKSQPSAQPPISPAAG